MPGDYLDDIKVKEHIKGVLAKIAERASKASPKVAERAQRFIDKVGALGGDQYAFSTGIERQKNDFFHLRANPADEDVSAGQYDGWEPNEIEELYEVLYGEKLED